MSGQLVLLGIDGELVVAAPADRRDAPVVVGLVVRARGAWDAVVLGASWLGAYASRYAAAHAVVDHAAGQPNGGAAAVAGRRIRPLPPGEGVVG